LALGAEVGSRRPRSDEPELQAARRFARNLSCVYLRSITADCQGHRSHRPLYDELRATVGSDESCLAHSRRDRCRFRFPRVPIALAKPMRLPAFFLPAIG